MTELIWLASYPKSGNTWFRAFLSSLLRGGAPIDINALDGDGAASSRRIVDEELGVSASELPPSLVAALLPLAWASRARSSKYPLHVKIHDRYSGELPGRALYFVRNPLDVCVSFAHHNGHSDYSATADRMADPDLTMAPAGRFHPHLPQPVGTWSSHVTGWSSAPIPVKVVRYEDMIREPALTFAQACRFADLPMDPVLIARSLSHCSLAELRRQEEVSGFGERRWASPLFFRRGGVGGWRSQLTAGEAGRLIADHGAAMKRLGYLTDSGDPVY